MFKKVNLLFNYCNARCRMCSMNFDKEHNRILNHYPGAAAGQIAIDEYRGFFDEVKKKTKNAGVSIAGGEPLMYPDIVPLIECIANECRLPVGITTNGTVGDKEKLKALAAQNVHVTFSIDGLAETHNKNRGEGSFEKVIEAVTNFNRLRQDTPYKKSVSALFVLHKKNYRDLEQVARLLLDEIGIAHLTVSSLIFSSKGLNDKHNEWVRRKGLSDRYLISNIRCGDPSFIFDKAQLGEVFKKKRELKNKYPRLGFEPAFASLEDMEDYYLTDKLLPGYFSSFCRPLQTNLTLISNGDVLFSPGCYEIKLGNIREQSIMEIWNGKRYKELRETLSTEQSPICSHCCANRVEKV